MNKKININIVNNKSYFIFFIIVMSFLLIPNISAFDFDNSLSYKNNDMTIQIDNLFGIGGKIGEATLTSHKTINEIKVVKTGEQAVIWYKFNFNDNYKNGLGKVYFTDLKTGKDIQRSYYFAKAIYEIKDVTNINPTCTEKNEINGSISKICYYGTHQENTIVGWKKLDNNDIIKGDVTIGIITNVEEGDYIDVKLTIAGIKIEKHAPFTTRYEYYYSTTTGESGPRLNFWATQTFTVGTTGTNQSFTIEGVNLKLYKQGIPTDGTASFPNYTVLITATSSGNPDFNYNLSNGNFNASELSTDTNGVWYNITLNGSMLQSGATYSIVLFSTGGDGTNRVHWMVDFGTGAYSGGGFGSGSNYGDGLTVIAGNDAGFEVWGKQSGSPTSINVQLNQPTDGINTINTYVNFSGNASIVNANITNMTLWVWNGNTLNFTITNSTPIGLSNYSNYSNINFASGSYKWNIRTCGANSTSTICEFAQSNRTFNIINFISLVELYNNYSIEGNSEKFTINFSIGVNKVANGGYLIYNGTAYPANINNFTSINYSLDKTINLPLVSSNIQNDSFYWIINYTDGSSGSTLIRNQSVYQTSFKICNITFNNTYINFTFKNEVNLSHVFGAIDSSTFIYYINDASINRTLTYSNLSYNQNYSFCFSPSYRSINLSANIRYSGDGYPQRIYSKDLIEINNLTTEKILYLLSSSDGIYVTFQVINAAEQPLQNVITNATRTINGIDEIVGQGLTGSDGGITFWLNPNFLHTFNFLLNPYPLYTTSITPTQSSYTISLGSSSSANITDYFNGISYSVKPVSTYLTNGSLYGFNFTIASSYWDLDSWGFNLTNQNGTLIGSTSSSGNSGTVNLNRNTGQNDTFIITYYWIIDGVTTQASRNWIIIDLSGNTFSIYHLLTDFKTYTGLGLFGLTNFGVGIICFLIIIMITGTLKIKYGVSNDSVICGIIFGIVTLLDVSFGLIPNPVGAVNNFPTIFVGIIFSGFLFKEVFT